MVLKHSLCRRAAAAALAGLLLAGCTRPAVLQPSSSSPSSQPAASGSSAPETGSGTSQPARFAIAVSEGSYNPYLNANTLTEQVAGLLFEKLVRISPRMELEMRLADSVVSSGVTVTIRLRSGCTFADGTPLTASDVAASLLAAKASAHYSGRLANLTDAQAPDAGTVVLTLAEPDSLFAYLLDLPILKAAETASPQPTPCGRYTYGTQADTLTPNPRAPFPEEGPATIWLTPVSDYAELVSQLAMGEISFYLAEEAASSAVATSERYFRTNTLLFLGVNGSADNPLCATSQGRAALSAALSREELAGRFASASPATGALNNLYECVRGQQVIAEGADPGQLSTLMAALGYHWDEASALYCGADGQPASVSILACGSSADRVYAARLLQQQWEKAGIQVTLTLADDFGAYLQMVQDRQFELYMVIIIIQLHFTDVQFELYIGEMKLYNNNDLSPFWTGSAHYGLAVTQQLLDAYDRMRADSSAAPDFETVFAGQMPYIPLLWRGGVTVSNRRTSGVISSVSDLYYSLASLSIAQ